MEKRIPRMRTNKVNPRKGGQRDDGQGKGDIVEEEQEEDWEERKPQKWIFP